MWWQMMMTQLEPICATSQQMIQLLANQFTADAERTDANYLDGAKYS